MHSVSFSLRKKCPSTDQKKLGIWTLFTQCQYQCYQEIVMFKVVEPLKRNDKNHETLLIVSCVINSFLIYVSETFQIVFSKDLPNVWMLKHIGMLQQKQEKDLRSSLLFLVFCIKRSFIIWVAKFNLTVFYMIKTGICMHKSVEIFEYFSKKFTQHNFFLLRNRHCLFFYLWL